MFLLLLVAGSSKDDNGAGLKDMTLWSIAECVQVFKDSVHALRKQLDGLAEGSHLIWDKDEKESMDFVAACANIRCHIFHIEQKSRFEIKCESFVNRPSKLSCNIRGRMKQYTSTCESVMERVIKYHRHTFILLVFILLVYVN